MLLPLGVQGLFQPLQLQVRQNPDDSGQTTGLESCGGNILKAVFLVFPVSAGSLLLHRNKGKASEGSKCQGKACYLPGDRGIIQLE